MELEGTVFNVYVLKRPGVEDFLRCVSRHYEVVIYTASLAKYADPLISLIDPERCAAHRLFREHCTFYNNSFAKDLTLLGRNLKNVIIVDNSPASYALQPENALPIQTWTDDMSDKSLYELIPILEALSRMPDVRKGLGKIVHDDQIDYVSALNALRSVPPPHTKAPFNAWEQGTGGMSGMKKSESTARIVVPSAQNEGKVAGAASRTRSSTPSEMQDPRPHNSNGGGHNHGTHAAAANSVAKDRHAGTDYAKTEPKLMAASIGINSPKSGHGRLIEGFLKKPAAVSQSHNFAREDAHVLRSPVRSVRPAHADPTSAPAKIVDTVKQRCDKLTQLYTNLLVKNGASGAKRSSCDLGGQAQDHQVAHDQHATLREVQNGENAAGATGQEGKSAATPKAKRAYSVKKDHHQAQGRPKENTAAKYTANPFLRCSYGGNSTKGLVTMVPPGTQCMTPKQQQAFFRVAAPSSTTHLRESAKFSYAGGLRWASNGQLY